MLVHVALVIIVPQTFVAMVVGRASHAHSIQPMEPTPDAGE
jgi:hypothetical protein